MPFRAINRAGRPGYNPGLQRHHLLPCQLLRVRALQRLIEAVPPRLAGFDDFRRNGLLLPACDRTAQIMGLPLHRGPHPIYNDMALERVGAIEREWSHARRRARREDWARDDALFRLALLQRALRRRLLRRDGTALALSRHDPALRSNAFADLDAMADQLWAATAPDW